MHASSGSPPDVEHLSSNIILYCMRLFTLEKVCTYIKVEDNMYPFSQTVIIYSNKLVMHFPPEIAQYLMFLVF